MMEGAEDCLISSSGMCSATTMLLALVPPGGHIVTTTDCYRRTRQFIQTLLPKMGISATVIDPSDLKGLEVSMFPPARTTRPRLLRFEIRSLALVPCGRPGDPSRLGHPQRWLMHGPL